MYLYLLVFFFLFSSLLFLLSFSLIKSSRLSSVMWMEVLTAENLACSWTYRESIKTLTIKFVLTLRFFLDTLYEIEGVAFCSYFIRGFLLNEYWILLNALSMVIWFFILTTFLVHVMGMHKIMVIRFFKICWHEFHWFLNVEPMFYIFLDSIC